MLTSEVEDVTRREWRHICRIIDAATDNLYVGTVVLVSDQGKEFGYALTCWHNFDPEYKLKEFTDERQLDGIWLLPNWADVDDSTKRRPVVVVGRWSNSIQDFAVLKIPRNVIEEFRLRPSSISFNIYPGMRLFVAGFQRPGELLDPDLVQIKVTKDAEVYKQLRGGQRVFEVESADPMRNIPFDAGMSGGGMFEKQQRVLVGLAASVGPNETGSHRYRGYGVPLSTIAETWATIADYCQVVRIRKLPMRVPLIIAVGIVLVITGLEVSRIQLQQAQLDAGKVEATAQVFPVEENYIPSGKMGDVGDVEIGSREGETRRFIYETRGRGSPLDGSHEWAYKYKNDKLNPQIAQFAGVVYLSPADVWGTLPNCGYDLRGFQRLRWEARSLSGRVNVDFVVGGIDWIWDDRNMKQVGPPYPDLIRKAVGGVLTEEWQAFKLSLLDQPEDNLKRVVGGFGWVIGWGSNGVELNDAGTGPREVKKFVIEIRNVRYERTVVLPSPPSGDCVEENLKKLMDKHGLEDNQWVTFGQEAEMLKGQVKVTLERYDKELKLLLDTKDGQGKQKWSIRDEPVQFSIRSKPKDAQYSLEADRIEDKRAYVIVRFNEEYTQSTLRHWCREQQR